MINLRNSPFLCLALPLWLAFMLDDHVRLRWTPWIYIMFGVLMAACFLGALMRYNPKVKYLSTLSVTGLVFLAGLWHHAHFNNALYPFPPISAPIQVEGQFVIDRVLKNKNASVTIKAQVIEVQPVQEKTALLFQDRYVLLHLRHPQDQLLLPEDQICLSGWMAAIPGPVNPQGFDARAYYQTIGLRHQISGDSREALYFHSNRHTLKRITAAWQIALSKKVKKYTTDEEAQVINALVWGNRNDMTSDVRDAFAGSGAMHVLSVSGMHVAMIYSMLFLLLGKPDEGIFSVRLVRFIAYASAILLYVGLTGASPAVVRAGLMILLFLFGKAMGWNTQIWNLLGFAAFMMLWLNPAIFQNIGFQLSFLAIAGILLFAKPIIRSLVIKWKVIQWGWEMIALSLAAQVFILPILLGQFHQFPLTFILSSMVAIPAGYIILLGTLLNVLLSALGVDLLWPILAQTTHVFIQVMTWMAGLNPEMNYSLPAPAGWLIFLMSVFFSASWMYRWSSGKKIAYVSGAGALACLFFHRMDMWTSREVIVYHTYKGVLADAISGGYCYAIRAGDLSPNQMEYTARGHRCQRDIISAFALQDSIGYTNRDINWQQYTLDFDTFTLFLLNKNSIPRAEGKNFTHILVAEADSLEAVKRIMCCHPHAQNIFPASLPGKIKRRLVKYADDNQLNYYDISESGYLRLTE